VCKNGGEKVGRDVHSASEEERRREWRKIGNRRMKKTRRDGIKPKTTK
jgi:hypothetical protein